MMGLDLKRARGEGNNSLTDDQWRKIKLYRERWHEHTPLLASCPTITGSNKKTTKRRHLRPLNRKIRNSFITDSNCRTACLCWGGRTQFDFFLRKLFLKCFRIQLMRIWDIPPEKMCRQHLLGEHRELHALWSIITNNKKAYIHHPETLRWKGKLKALYLRHESLVCEMAKRGYKHHTPLDPALASGTDFQDEFVNSYEDQVRILNEKGCMCRV